HRSRTVFLLSPAAASRTTASERAARHARAHHSHRRPRPAANPVPGAGNDFVPITRNEVIQHQSFSGHYRTRACEKDAVEKCIIRIHWRERVAEARLYRTS